MKTQYAVALALLAGFGLGAVAVQGLHAEAKPPAYYISEIVVRDIDPYLKEYLPKVKASVKAFGGKSLAGGDKIIPIEGDPPKHRVALVCSTASTSSWPGGILPNTRRTARSATNTRRSRPMPSRA